MPVQPATLDNPAPIIHPNPSHHITAVEYDRSVGYNCSFLVTPPIGAILFPISTNISAREFRGGS